MSNAFNNFLKDVSSALFEGEGANLRDYQHADRLYVANNYARMPKVGFLYFVVFNINDTAISDPEWRQRNKRDVGLLVKKIDLPKYKITTETVNQYNRKTNVQTKVTYNPVNIDFHDDNSDITNNLWKNYFTYYYADSVYGSSNTGKNIIEQYSDTKYASQAYAYGLNNNQKNPFFQSVDIYLLHKGRGDQDFTHITLINPLITDWNHDNLDQNENGKILTNRMTLSYEFVTYKTGKIINNTSPAGFASIHYDKTPSPLGIGSGGSLLGSGGIISGIDTVFGANGSLANARTPLDFLTAALQTKQLAKNVKKLKSENLKFEGYLMAASALAGALATDPNQPRNTNQGITGIAPVTNSSVDDTVIAENKPLTKL